MAKYIYAVKDRGFERGVKIGRDSHFPNRYRCAQCYSPRGIDLVAAWNMESRSTSFPQAEREARHELQLVYGRNSGVEWVDLTSEEAIRRVSENLGVDPEIVNENPPITTTYDDFRDPKKLGREKHRQAHWIYQENKTGLLKVQRTSSWKVPLEPIKTFSLLGFKPVAAFLHPGSEMRIGNRHIQDIWDRLVTEFGHGVDHVQVGWLREGVDLKAIRDRVLSSGLKEVPSDRWGIVPTGLKAGY